MDKVPRHIVAVSAFIKNKEGKVLLVKTHFRSDTWEIPGGQVEVGEPLHKAVIREVEEETGIRIKPTGITGVYYNVSIGLVSVVFSADYISGELRTQESEIKETGFFELTEENLNRLIIRPHFKSRIIDAMSGKCIPYESWEVNPYNLTIRIDS